MNHKCRFAACVVMWTTAVVYLVYTWLLYTQQCDECMAKYVLSALVVRLLFILALRPRDGTHPLCRPLTTMLYVPVVMLVVAYFANAPLVYNVVGYVSMMCDMVAAFLSLRLLYASSARGSSLYTSAPSGAVSYTELGGAASYTTSPSGDEAASDSATNASTSSASASAAAVGSGGRAAGNSDESKM